MQKDGNAGGDQHGFVNGVITHAVAGLALLQSPSCFDHDDRCDAAEQYQGWDPMVKGKLKRQAVKVRHTCWFEAGGLLQHL